MSDKSLKNESLSDAEIAARMDRAIRRSLQMPPKLHKETRKPRQSKAHKAAAKPETPPLRRLCPRQGGDMLTACHLRP
jgi:hypothetical protein